MKEIEEKMVSWMRLRVYIMITGVCVDDVIIFRRRRFRTRILDSKYIMVL